MIIEEAEKQHQATAKQGASWVNLLSILASLFTIFMVLDRKWWGQSEWVRIDTGLEKKFYMAPEC